MPQDKDTRVAASLASWDTLLRAETMRRILVTILVICLYRLGSQIPAPGLDLNILNLSTSDMSVLPIAARERFSIFALGLIPVLSAMILGEVLKLVAPSLRAALATRDAARTTYNRAIIVTGLVFAAVQSYGIALGLEAIDVGGERLVQEPGAGFRIVLAETLIAATALLVWFANIITRHGLGSGFWIIALYPSVRSFADLPDALQVGIGQGIISANTAIATVAALIAIAAVLTTLYRARLPDDSSALPTPNPEEPLRGRVLTAGVWPAVIASSITAYLPVVGWALSGREDSLPSQSIFAYGRPGDLLAVALLTGLLTLILSPGNQGETGRVAARITAVALAVIVSGITFATLNVPASIAEGSWLIAMVVVCLAMLPGETAQLVPQSKPLSIEPHD